MFLIGIRNMFRSLVQQTVHVVLQPNPPLAPDWHSENVWNPCMGLKLTVHTVLQIRDIQNPPPAPHMHSKHVRKWFLERFLDRGTIPGKGFWEEEQFPEMVSEKRNSSWKGNMFRMHVRGQRRILNVTGL